jgi:hypothetical protein
MTKRDERAHPPNWMFEIDYWVADGDPDPDVPWPDDWEVCGMPDFEPLSMSAKDRRHGSKCLAWPMYAVQDPVASLDSVCSFLEQMTPAALAIWLSLPDRYLRMSCTDTEMDAAEMNTRGFFFPPNLIQRIRRLRLRLSVGFHPQAKIRWEIAY